MLNFSYMLLLDVNTLSTLSKDFMISLHILIPKKSCINDNCYCRLESDVVLTCVP